jgi:hypothetical protein
VLRVYAPRGSRVRYVVRGAANHSWNDGTIIHGHVLPLSAESSNLSGAFAANTWTSFDLAELIAHPTPAA